MTDDLTCQCQALAAELRVARKAVEAFHSLIGDDEVDISGPKSTIIPAVAALAAYDQTPKAVLDQLPDPRHPQPREVPR